MKIIIIILIIIIIIITVIINRSIDLISNLIVNLSHLSSISQGINRTKFSK